MIINPSVVFLLLSVLPTDKKAVKRLTCFLAFVLFVIGIWVVMLFQFYYRLLNADVCRVIN